MKIIYAEKSTGINEDASFQNPKYFERPDSDAVAVVIYGDYPEIEAAYQALGVEVEVREVAKPTNQITVTLTTELAPELQQVIDDAKAECKKVQDENTDLITDLKEALDAKDQVQAKLTETESQLGVLQTENTELKAKITELEKAAVKKPTAAELKAAKAAEDAKAAEAAKAAEDAKAAEAAKAAEDAKAAEAAKAAEQSQE